MTFPHDNLQGPHTYLDDVLIEKIIAAVPQVFIMRHVANLIKLNDKTLYCWMKRGDKDIQAGEETSVYAKLYKSYQQALSEALREKLEILARCPKNYGAITWILEKCFKDDFETKSEAHKQLEDYVENVIKPMLGKGELANGGKETKEMDSQGHEEQGCTAP